MLVSYVYYVSSYETDFTRGIVSLNSKLIILSNLVWHGGKLFVNKLAAILRKSYAAVFIPARKSTYGGTSFYCRINFIISYY